MLYPLLMVRVIFNIPYGSCFWDSTIKPNLPLLVILLGLFIVSISWLCGVLKWKNNTRIKGEAPENKTIVMAKFLATYIVPLLTIDLNWIGLVISITMYFVFGIFFVVSNNHFLNPTFILFGYKLYKIDKMNVLCKYSLDELKIELLENYNGVNARELVHNTYIILPD